MAPKRILVVEDDSYVRKATEAFLARKGYDVETASEAQSALTNAKKNLTEVMAKEMQTKRKQTALNESAAAKNRKRCMVFRLAKFLFN